MNRCLRVYSREIQGQRLFRSFYETDGAYDMTEDQLMEEFAFGVAKRHLGVKISTAEDEELSFEIPFRRYEKKAAPAVQATPAVPVTPAEQTVPTKGSWLPLLFNKK